MILTSAVTCAISVAPQQEVTFPVCLGRNAFSNESSFIEPSLICEERKLIDILYFVYVRHWHWISTYFERGRVWRYRRICKRNGNSGWFELLCFITELATQLHFFSHVTALSLLLRVSVRVNWNHQILVYNRLEIWRRLLCRSHISPHAEKNLKICPAPLQKIENYDDHYFRYILASISYKVLDSTFLEVFPNTQNVNMGAVLGQKIFDQDP